MIHAAIMGSIERFLSVIIEHFAGAFPVWLAPVQVAVLPVSEKFTGYATEIYDILLKENIRSEFSNADESLSKRIRETEIMKVPYVIVIGDGEEKEKTMKTIALRNNRTKESGTMFLEKFLPQIHREIESKKF